MKTQRTPRVSGWHVLVLRGWNKIFDERYVKIRITPSGSVDI